jgi:hypothetical protein
MPREPRFTSATRGPGVPLSNLRETMAPMRPRSDEGQDEFARLCLILGVRTAAPADAPSRLMRARSGTRLGPAGRGPRTSLSVSVDFVGEQDAGPVAHRAADVLSGCILRVPSSVAIGAVHGGHVKISLRCMSENGQASVRAGTSTRGAQRP